MAFLAVKIPKCDWIGPIGVIDETDARGAFSKGDMQLGALAACLRQSRQITFHIRQKDWHTGGRKAFGQDLERHRLAGTCRPRDQPVAIGVFQQKLLWLGVIRATPRR